MEYRILGKTGLRVSRVGLGGIPIQRIDALGTRELLRVMMAEGMNYIDTARGYTVSEEYLGFALEGIREHFVLATKGRATTKEEMAADIDHSLHNLRTNTLTSTSSITLRMLLLTRFLPPAAHWRPCWKQSRPERLATLV